MGSRSPSNLADRTNNERHPPSQGSVNLANQGHQDQSLYQLTGDYLYYYNSFTPHSTACPHRCLYDRRLDHIYYII